MRKNPASSVCNIAQKQIGFTPDEIRLEVGQTIESGIIYWSKAGRESCFQMISNQYKELVFLKNELRKERDDFKNIMKIQKDNMLILIRQTLDGLYVGNFNYFGRENVKITTKKELTKGWIEDYINPIKITCDEVLAKPDSGEKFSPLIETFSIFIKDAEKALALIFPQERTTETGT